MLLSTLLFNMSTISSITEEEEDDDNEEHGRFKRKQMAYELSEIGNSDEEYDTDIEIDDRRESYDGTGKKAYQEACKKYNTNPVSYFVKNMGETEINMSYHGIGTKGAKAIATALVLNTVTLTVNLMENSIGIDGVKAIADMLKENCYITDLNVSMNNLGPDGCNSICEMLQHNLNLKTLDLSHNHFGDSVGQCLADAFKNNFKLLSLNLSGNELSDNVGIALGPAVNANDAMEYINLSWNQLRNKATQEIAAGLRANCTVKVIDLSWNGFSNAGAIALANALTCNNTLIELNISHNRIALEGALGFAKSLGANNTLEVLKFNGNPITCKGAHALLTAIINKSDSAVRELHIKGVSLQDEFNQLYEASKETKNILVYASFRVASPLEKLQEFIKLHKAEWIEAFGEVDTSGCYRVTVTQFRDILKQLSFGLTVEEEFVLIDRVKKDSHGRIKYRDPLLGFEKEVSTEC